LDLDIYERGVIARDGDTLRLVMVHGAGSAYGHVACEIVLNSGQLGDFVRTEPAPDRRKDA